MANKSEPKTFAVNVEWVVSRLYEIEAGSREEAVEKMQEQIDHGEVCVWSDGFIATDHVKCEVHGETDESGEMQFD